MNRLAQSTFVYLTLGLLVLLAVLNTVQLHNLENKVAELRQSGGPSIAARSDNNAGQTAAASSPTCPTDPEVERDLAAPGNLLKPGRRPKDFPANAQLGGTLRRQTAQDPPGLNYMASKNAADVHEIYLYVSNTLAQRDVDDPDRWNAALATSVTTDDEGLSYVVKLRKGVKWQKLAVDLNDPRYAWANVDHEVTAEDFKFTFDIYQNVQVGGRAAAGRSAYSHLDKVEVLDTYSFKVTFKERLYVNFGLVVDNTPMPRWLYLYDENGQKFDDTNWGEKLNAHWYNQKAIGVGPYQFVSWETGVKIKLERNPNYWDCAQPAPFDRIEMVMLKDPQAWLRYLKTGQIDYTQVMPQQYVSELKGKEPYLGEKGLKIGFHDELSYFYIGWNQRRPFFEDKRVRTAMTLAFNREALVENVFGGLGEVVSGPYVKKNPCYDQSIAPLPFDLEQAKKLLEEAGWTDTDGDGIRDKVIKGKKTPFEFSLLMYGGSSEYETLARIYREDLLQVGIKLNPLPLEWSAQLKQQESRDFDAYTGAWVPDWDIDLKPIWHSSTADQPASSNYIGFKNAEADRLIDAHRQEQDPEKRAGYCQAFHRLVAEEQPYSFFYARKRPVLYWDYVNPLFTVLYPYRDLRYFSFNQPRE